MLLAIVVIVGIAIYGLYHVFKDKLQVYDPNEDYIEWLRKVQKDDPKHYDEIVKRFGDEVYRGCLEKDAKLNGKVK